jgi:hypothetical protein
MRAIFAYQQKAAIIKGDNCGEIPSAGMVIGRENTALIPDQQGSTIGGQYHQAILFGSA